MSDNIVTRLRVWSDWLDERVPDTAVGNDLREAADEIERLREELTTSHESHGNEVGALTERLLLAIHQRDDARREVCLLRASTTSAVSLHGYAVERGWDDLFADKGSHERDE
jgi:hypothetical protein